MNDPIYHLMILGLLGVSIFGLITRPAQALTWVCVIMVAIALSAHDGPGKHPR